MYKKEQDVLENDMREIDECDMEEFATLDGSEKMIAIFEDRLGPQADKQKGENISKHSLRNTWKQRKKRPPVVRVFTSSSNGGPSRQGCVVNGRMTKANDK